MYFTTTLLWTSVAVASPIAATFESATSLAVTIRTDENKTETLHVDAKSPVHYGEAPYARTIYTVVSLVCMLLLASMLGFRTKQLHFSNLKAINFIRLLIIILYMLAIAFVISAAVVENGLGLSSFPICHTAIIICLVFYVGSKVTMYIFLAERAHAMRAPYLRRAHDWIWLAGMLMVGIGFGSIAVVAFTFPVANLSVMDGRCRIGLPLKVTIPLLSFDAIINLVLTGVFIHLLRPLLSFGGISDISPLWVNRWMDKIRGMLKTKEAPSSALLCPANRSLLRSVEVLLWKSLFGSILVMLPTVANLGLLYHMKGRELGWLCFTVCTIDGR
ncbi:hypothetical protein K432DRAFT_344472 [Lepidopterella palustris CBS 459.81]|uniref:Uncharacterized protein n=1 Tax=Lepidopterella palustris CBS 459.81 TaxID=1314670 RepID=A0A8E2EIU7_9PEZI|nr:hypothetical protein K432DRAFT_344472 [Lepidopterella palustris CBS 459.81]